MPAANYHYLSVTPAGGAEILFHSFSGVSVITNADLKCPLDVAEVKVSANVTTALPVSFRYVQSEDTTLDVTVLRRADVNAALRTCKGKICAVKYRESVAAISSDNPEVQYNAVCNSNGEMGGQVAGGVPTQSFQLAVCDGVAAVYDTTP